MPGPTNVRTELKGSIGIISLTGDLTAELEKPFSDAYKEVTKSGAAKILLRFSGECFMNSAGIALIILLADRAAEASQKVGVVGLSPHFEKIFEMIGLTDYLTVFHGEDTALKLL
jgi:anti-anti-sigma factor